MWSPATAIQTFTSISLLVGSSTALVAKHWASAFACLDGTCRSLFSTVKIGLSSDASAIANGLDPRVVMDHAFGEIFSMSRLTKAGLRMVLVAEPGTTKNPTFLCGCPTYKCRVQAYYSSDLPGIAGRHTYAIRIRYLHQWRPHSHHEFFLDGIWAGVRVQDGYWCEPYPPFPQRNAKLLVADS